MGAGRAEKGTTRLLNRSRVYWHRGGGGCGYQVRPATHLAGPNEQSRRIWMRCIYIKYDQTRITTSHLLIRHPCHRGGFQTSPSLRFNSDADLAQFAQGRQRPVDTHQNVQYHASHSVSTLLWGSCCGLCNTQRFTAASHAAVRRNGHYSSSSRIAH